MIDRGKRILFLTTALFEGYEANGIYTDLMRQLILDGNQVVTVVAGSDKTAFSDSMGNKILRVKTGSISATPNLITKGLNVLLLDFKYKHVIKKYLKSMEFDLIIYSTPPITIFGSIKYAKKKFKAKTYLLLKDIFPQNAVDIKLLSTGGIKGFIYRYFKALEKKYYLISDHIGCMSENNVEYLLNHNTYLDASLVHVNPNSLDLRGITEVCCDKGAVKKQYGIPEDAKVFVYGGNLGKPQDVPYIIECLKANANKPDRFFVISGNGGCYHLLKSYYEREKPQNILLINGLPKLEYHQLVEACDVGLIFLDHRFTIPNYPSRLLAYLRASMPVFANTDTSTDLGKNITDGGFGWYAESNDTAVFTETVDKICAASQEQLDEMGRLGKQYLTARFNVCDSTQIIYNVMEDNDK